MANLISFKIGVDNHFTLLTTQFFLLMELYGEWRFRLSVWLFCKDVRIILGIKRMPQARDLSTSWTHSCKVRKDNGGQKVRVWLCKAISFAETFAVSTSASSSKTFLSFCCLRGRIHLFLPWRLILRRFSDFKDSSRVTVERFNFY